MRLNFLLMRLLKRGVSFFYIAITLIVIAELIILTIGSVQTEISPLEYVTCIKHISTCSLLNMFAKCRIMQVLKQYFHFLHYCN